jgi:4-hydroxy-tetrahydrodipicolinate reductase
VLTIGLQGATGRTGKLVLEVISEFSDVKLTHLSKRTPNGLKHYDIHGVELDAGDNPDVWIDFSTPEASIELIHSIVDVKSSSGVIIATTGHSAEQLEFIRRAAAKIPILMAPNTSLGIFALKELAALACTILSSDDWQIHVEEAHHKFKKDAPSGTAKLLVSAAKDGRASVDRPLETVPTSSIRGGDIVGEHTVYLISNGERIELTHRATDRRIFARGSIELAKVLSRQPAGIYGLTREFFLGNSF